MAEVDRLNLIYADEFGENNYHFFRKHIKLNVGSWMYDLKNLIDAECLYNLTYELNENEKPIIVVRFLTQQNSVPKYKQFISIWKKHGPAKVIQFENSLRQKIKNAGLTSVDNQFQVASQGILSHYYHCSFYCYYINYYYQCCFYYRYWYNCL